MKNTKKIKYITDSNGNPLILKILVIQIIGLLSYWRFRFINKLKITGMENLKNLPKQKVLFVSNHQTYFADVTVLYHIFCAQKNDYKNNIKTPYYLLNPRVNMFYVAARETMTNSILSRIFSLAGAVMVQRTWREKGQEITRNVNFKDTNSFSFALKDGWVITFPQGTTKPFMPGRKGTAHIIKDNNPIVVPVRIDGFRRAFDKKGLLLKKKGTKLTVNFKAPIQFKEEDSLDTIMDTVMAQIEQTPEHNLVDTITE